MADLHDKKTYCIIAGESFNDLFVRYPELADNKEDIDVKLIQPEKNSVLITKYIQSTDKSNTCSDTDVIKLDNLTREQRCLLDMISNNVKKDGINDEDFKDNANIKELIKNRMVVDMKLGGVPKGLTIKKCN